MQSDNICINHMQQFGFNVEETQSKHAIVYNEYIRIVYSVCKKYEERIKSLGNARLTAFLYAARYRLRAN